jgi:hypothetical protein
MGHPQLVEAGLVEQGDREGRLSAGLCLLIYTRRGRLEGCIFLGYRVLRDAEKGLISNKTSERHPSGAKARRFLSAIYGTTEVVPFQNIESFCSR